MNGPGGGGKERRKKGRREGPRESVPYCLCPPALRGSPPVSSAFRRPRLAPTEASVLLAPPPPT